MNKVTLNAELRKIKDNLKVLRQSGRIPAVIYGKNIISKPIHIDNKLFNLIIKNNGDNAIIDLDLQKEITTVLIKTFQRDIITQKIIHVDFQIIFPEDLVEVLIPIHTEGVAIGVKNFGGIIDFVLREVKIKTLPSNIPQKIDVNISNLQIGQGITVADLPHIDGIEYLDKSSRLILHVISPSIIENKDEPIDSTNKEKITNVT
jgi:large subunit ribosomal protein L25